MGGKTIRKNKIAEINIVQYAFFWFERLKDFKINKDKINTNIEKIYNPKSGPIGG